MSRACAGGLRYLVETWLLGWATLCGGGVHRRQHVGTNCPFPLLWLRMSCIHGPLGTLNNFGEATMITFFPFHLRCCCDSQALVTSTPTARRWGREGCCLELRTEGSPGLDPTFWESLRQSASRPPPTWQRRVRSEDWGPTSCTPEGFWPLSRAVGS